RNGWPLMHALPATIKPAALREAGAQFHPYRSLVAWDCWRAVGLLQREMVLPGATRASPLALRSNPRAWLQRVGRPVAGEVAGQRRDSQNRRGHQAEVGSNPPLVEVVVDHRSPTGSRRLDANAKVAERSLEDHRVGKTERRGDNDRPQRIRNDVA